MAHFNPRVPCGTRLTSQKHLNGYIIISIHGSRVGPDEIRSFTLTISSVFQSTGPVWDPTTPIINLKLSALFQSTGPVWDPTPFQVVRFSLPSLFQSTGPVWDPTSCKSGTLSPIRHFNPRVPCGTRLTLIFVSAIHTKFQSTGPVWDPTSSASRPPKALVFQSTGPVWDPTGMWQNSSSLKLISIHGSRVGPDSPFSAISSSSLHFNPRVPCGTRRNPIFRARALKYFNPRVPCGTRPHSFQHLLCQ